jgi:hypothetical protein
LTGDDLRAIALRILRSEPDPAIRIRLLRDVLHAQMSDPRLRKAQQDIKDSAAIQHLAAEQGADGGWGRLHSRDTRALQRVPTTEWAVARAVDLGLDGSHPMLQRAADFLSRILEGRLAPIDPPERNDRWSVGVALFAASTLARIAPDHSAVGPVRELWEEVLRRTFAGGGYDAEAEVQAHRDLSGASVRQSYLVLANRYAITLFGSAADRLGGTLREAYCRWIWERAEGIGYLGVCLSSFPPEGASAGTLENWFSSHELFARLDPEVPLTPLVDWLDSHRRSDGLWDFGSRVPHSTVLPLSATWRAKDARASDWSTRVLALLSRWIG